MSLRLAFAGRARSGKSTAGDLYRSHGALEIRFSDELYRIHDMVIAEMRLQPGKYRGLLQYLGTDLGRNIDPDIWVHKFESKLRSLSPHLDLVCTDLRFPNEAECLKANGFKIIKIVRDSRPEMGGNENHISETALDDYDGWDAIVHNNGTMLDFYDRLDRIVKGLN